MTTSQVCDVRGNAEAPRIHCDRLAQQLREISSLSTFQSIDVASFRQQLRKLFGNTLDLSISSQIICSEVRRNSNNRPRARNRHIFDISTHTSASTSSIVRYDLAIIERCLRAIIPNLSDLFQAHDSQTDRLEKNLISGTALKEIINVLLDPTVLPMACVGAVVLFLTSAYVEGLSDSYLCTGTSNIVRTSDTAILRAICILVHRAPQLSLPRIIFPYLRKILTLHQSSPSLDGQQLHVLNTDVAKYNAFAAERCILFLQFALRALPQARMEHCAFSLIINAVKNIDDADVHLIRKTREPILNTVHVGKTLSLSSCSRCQPGSMQGAHIWPKEELMDIKACRRMSFTASLSDLHDDARSNKDEKSDSDIVIQSVSTESERITDTVYLSSRLREYGNVGRISMKRVMGATSGNDESTQVRSHRCACLCYITEKDALGSDLVGRSYEADHSPTKCSLLPINLVKLRCSLYSQIIDFAKSDFYDKLGKPSRKYFSERWLLCNILHVVKKDPRCAATRLAAILIADVRGIQHGFLPLFEKLLEMGEDYCWRIYAELVVDLAICDSADRFWKLFRQLLDKALEMTETLHTNEDEEVHMKWRKHTLTMLRAISFIFINRRRTLAAVARKEVQPRLSKLSICFGCQSYWVNDAMSSDEIDEIIATLQSLGILGIVLQDDDKDGECTIKDQADFFLSLAGENFPFSPPSSLRDGVGRMGPNVGCNRFLSRLDARFPLGLKESEQKSSTATNKKMRADRISEAPPLLECLNDDLIYRVVSFLSCRKLARMSGVCRALRSQCNESALWQRLYHLRFNVRRELDILPSSTNNVVYVRYVKEESTRDWRKLFDAKWAAERNLRSTFTKTGWRHKTCPFLGCLAVLKSKALFNTHVKKHKTEFLKKVARETAAEVREQKRKTARRQKTANDVKRKKKRPWEEGSSKKKEKKARK